MNSSEGIDRASEYINPVMVREHKRHIGEWAQDAAAYREAAGARVELDLAYGPRPRQRLDVFAPTSGARGPTALFIHGGYWQLMDKSSFSHMARGANEHGVTVAVTDYTLCPDTTLREIVDEIRKAVAFLVKRFGKPITVCGHSAGGHLAACMLATDWRAFDASLDSSTISSALPISGIFELEPLLATTLNDKLCLDAAEARSLSPLFWRAPAGKAVIAYVGANESSEFLRQTRNLIGRWSAEGVTATGVEVAGKSHFTVIAPLAEPTSSMTRDLVTLTRRK